jgi:hypothetical protein
VKTCRFDATFDFLARVFSVPVPDPQTLDRLNAEQVAARCHSDGFADQ